MSASNRPRRSTAAKRPDRRHIAVFAAFIVLVFAMGGGARDDIQSLLVLRPAAVGFAAWALLVAAPGDLKAVRTPLALLVALMALIAVQLVPLPPGLWHALPGREGIARRDGLAGLADIWRPLSLSPSKTWNSLVSLVVPLAALLLVAVQPTANRLRSVEIILIVAAASAVLGLAQVAGPADGPLYLYAITNDGTAVGLFANRNHHAAFLAATFPLLGWYFLFAVRNDLLLTRLWVAGVAGAGALWGLGIVMTGSRAGLVLFALALGIVVGLFRFAVKRGRFAHNRRNPKPFSTPKARIAVWVGLFAAMATTIWIVPQLPAYQRFGADDYVGDVRFAAAPTVFRIALDAFPAGTGFGTFEHVFKVYEPDALLKASYFNQAHNDILQLAVEAGLPGLVLVLVTVLFLLGRLRALLPWLRRSEPEAWLAVTSLASIGLLALASAADYPLRVPSQMVFFALLIAFSIHPSRTQQSDVRR